jgi:hypothetical protein
MTTHFDGRRDSAPAERPAPTFEINPAVLKMANLPGIDLVKVEPLGWVILLLEALAENQLRLEITFKSITAYAKGPVAIAAVVGVLITVLAVVVTARATDQPSRPSFEQLWDTRVPSPSFEQLWDTRVPRQIGQGEKGHE